MEYNTCGCAPDEQRTSRELWTHGVIDRVNKLRDQYWLHKPTIDVERAVSYTKSYQKNEAEETCIKRARALYDYMSEKTIEIYPNELIVGTYGIQPRAVLMCPEICTSWYKDEIDTMATRAQDPYQLSEESKKLMREVIFPYWEGRSMEDYYIANLSEDCKKVAYNTGVVFGENKSQAGAGEFAPGYENIIFKKGFKGIQQEAEENLGKLDPNKITTFIPHGAATWALPSGRKARLPLADGISPFPGYDHNGPSSVMKSITKLNHEKNGVGTLLNIKLSPSLIASENDKKNLIALLRSEGDLGGYHVQFNVVSTEKLKDAQKHPENYGDLLVRIAGYSAYFVELRKDAQESIIARTENKSW